LEVHHDHDGAALLRQGVAVTATLPRPKDQQRFCVGVHQQVVIIVVVFCVVCKRRYGVTHSGLDAMVIRYMDEMTTFANLPDSLAYPNHTRCDL
jgi:hypothetical protein